MSDARHHFKIGEVAEMIGVKPHVLRYWEQEFPALRPKKTRGAHRHYSRENVALAREIHGLVIVSGYSIAGARAKLYGARPASLRGDDLSGLRDDLMALRGELLALRDLVDGVDPDADALEDAVEEELVVATSSRSSARPPRVR